MEFIKLVLDVVGQEPSLPSPFLLYAKICDEIRGDYRMLKSAKLFYSADKKLGLCAFLRQDPSETGIRTFCQKGLDRAEAEALLEALFPPQISFAPPPHRIKTSPVKGKPTPQKQTPPKPKTPHAVNPLDALDENTLLHYASSDPFRGSDHTLHVDFDCPRLKSAYVTFQQPLFALEAQNMLWKLCPHCAKTPPMLLRERSKDPYAIHLQIMTDSAKKKARTARGF